LYITDCYFGHKPNCSLITSAIFVLQSTCGSTIGICWGEPYSLHWSSSQVAKLHDSSVVEPIASDVLAGTSDWVSAESSSAMELMV